MSHLGSRISALVDCRLDPAETERALIHVASCPRCAEELASARAAQAALARARQVPAPDPMFTQRLLAMRSAPPVRPGDPFAGTTPVTQHWEVHPRIDHGHGRQFWVFGTAIGISVATVALFILGSRPTVTPFEHPGAALALLGGASQSGIGSGADLDGLKAQGWQVPSELPEGWIVVGSQQDDERLELDMVGPDGTAVVVTEQQGRLNDSVLVGVPMVEVADRSVVVLSYSPWTVVWQAEATVIELVAQEDNPEVETLVASFPAAPYQDGVGDQIGRGWTEVTSFWS